MSWASLTHLLLLYLLSFPWVYYFIHWTSLAHLLPLYLFLFLWVCWACFLIPLLFSVSHLFYIIGLLLLLGPLWKVDINNGLTIIELYCLWIWSVVLYKNLFTIPILRREPRLAPWTILNHISLSPKRSKIYHQANTCQGQQKRPLHLLIEKWYIYIYI